MIQYQIKPKPYKLKSGAWVARAIIIEPTDSGEKEVIIIGNHYKTKESALFGSKQLGNHYYD